MELHAVANSHPKNLDTWNYKPRSSPTYWNWTHVTTCHGPLPPTGAGHMELHAAAHSHPLELDTWNYMPRLTPTTGTGHMGLPAAAYSHQLELDTCNYPSRTTPNHWNWTHGTTCRGQEK